MYEFGHRCPLIMIMIMIMMMMMMMMMMMIIIIIIIIGLFSPCYGTTFCKVQNNSVGET